MRDRLFLVPLLLGGLTGCQSFKERLFSPLTTRLDLVNTQLGETNRQLGPSPRAGPIANPTSRVDATEATARPSRTHE